MKLSIITVNLNNSNGLKKTLSSIWERQTFKDFEHIIIDGGSTDNSLNIIKSYADKLSYWISEPDKGIYNAMNKGIEKANGERLLFLNSGDWLADNALSEIFAEPFTEDIIYCDYMNVKREGEVHRVHLADTITLPYLMLESLGHPASFINRHLFDNNQYREEYKIISDWAFWIEHLIIKGESYRHLDIISSYYDLTGMSAKKENRDKISKERSTFLDKLFGERYGMPEIEKSIRAIDIISKHNSAQIIESEHTQRSLRQYTKLLLAIKRFFKTAG